MDEPEYTLYRLGAEIDHLVSHRDYLREHPEAVEELRYEALRIGELLKGMPNG